MKKIFKSKKFVVGLTLVIILFVIFLIFGKTTNKTANSGKEILWYGIVLQQTDEGYRVDASSYLNDSSYDNIIVRTNNTNLKEDDYIKIDGKYIGTTKYKSTMGLEISAHVVEAKTVEKSSYIDAISPTIKEVIINDSKTQFNYTVVLEKVEFSDKETRIYLKVENNGQANFNLYSFNMKISQDGKQFEEESNWDAEYPEIKTDLLPGNTTSGIVSFPKMEQSNFKLILDASSSDWDEDLEKFEFDIIVN